MKYPNKFAVPSRCPSLLKDMGIDVAESLTHAELPLDLFSRKDAFLTTDEYFRLWQGIDLAAGSEEVALLFVKYISAEFFDAPIFAALCCPDLNTAAQRLSEYKPLIGPLVLNVTCDERQTILEVSCAVKTKVMPYVLCMIEAVFFTQLARIATRKNITPKSVAVPGIPDNIKLYQDYFGCEVSQADKVTVIFDAADASQKFLTSSGQMWDFFEEKLNKQLADMTLASSMSERVRATLIESLPSGDSSIDVVASRLAISKRTLQRKLTDEAETFQSILTTLREQLARHYLEKSDLSLGEIAYLLGFKEPNSFVRAFNTWQGSSPSSYRSHFRH